MSSGPEFRRGLANNVGGLTPPMQQASRFEVAASNSLKEQIRAAIAEHLAPLMNNLSGGGDSVDGVQNGLNAWNTLSEMIDRGAGLDPTLGSNPSLSQILGGGGFADFHDPSIQEIFGSLVQAEKNLTLPLLPPSDSKKDTQPMSFYDLAHSKEVELNFSQSYFYECYQQAKHNNWNFEPLKDDHRVPRPIGVGGYHDWAETDKYCGFCVPKGLSWSCSRNGHDNWSVSQGEFIQSYGYGIVHHTGGPPKGDIYVKGSGAQMATWLFQQSGMADQFLSILKPQ